jgi:stage II sporulation protein E
MVLDTYLCRASFYKSGAAPTYVYRNGSLFKLRSHTVPVGIIKELDFRKIDLELSAGDLVVMVSDGVTDGKEECPWLFDLLRSQSSAEPERIAELIIKYAKSEGASDDISVIVAKIS